ncbi:hypothetical protein X801_04809, partial [Opisthorchis viverrini]
LSIELRTKDLAEFRRALAPDDIYPAFSKEKIPYGEKDLKVTAVLSTVRDKLEVCTDNSPSMNVRGFFKNVLNSEQAQDTSAIPPDDPNSGTLGSGVSGFLSGTTRFLDTVQNKKNGLLNDLTTKFSGIKLPGDQSGGRTKRKKTSRVQENEGDEESSASEYGDEGDKPIAISPDLEANFQNYSMHHTGRSAFAKELKRQNSIFTRGTTLKKVNELCLPNEPKENE